MMHKNALDLEVAKLKQCAPRDVSDQIVTAVLLALGSNYQADYYLPRVRQQLAALGDLTLSTAFDNPDFTATTDQPKPDYTNQCVYLSLTNRMTWQQLQQTLKRFESVCDRQRQTQPNSIRQVTMDIDVLLIKLAKTNDWMVMADRYPFKAHEMAGVVELSVKV